MMLKTSVSRLFSSYNWRHTIILVKKNISSPVPVSCTVNHFHTHEFLHCRNRSSALYVSGNRAQTVFGVLSPYLDISKTLQNVMELEYNIKLRKRNLDLEYLLQTWEELQHLKSLKTELEDERTAIASTMRSLALEKDQSKKEEMLNWKARGREVREKLKAVTKDVGDIEDTVVLAFLQLPNKLHRLVGEKDKVLVSLFSKPSFEFEAKGHETIGKLNKELEFIDNSPNAYYLKNKLAILELSCSEYFSSVFKNHGYLHHSNPDFAKGVVVEGSGINVSEMEKVFMLTNHNSDGDQNNQYLVGGASLQSFSAYFTKQVIDNPECLPQKLITIGRSYLPSSNKASGLFNCWQSTVVDGLVIFQNNAFIQEQVIDETLMALVQSYTQLKIHFQVKQYAAHNLEPHESAAIGVLMFSPITKSYEEIGRISVCGDYISKRLLMLHKVTNNSASFLSMVYVRVCNITHLLAVIMENGQTKDGAYEVPDVLRKFMYV